MMNKKLSGVLFIFIFIVSTVSIISIVNAETFQSPSTKNSYDDDEPSAPNKEWDFYDAIGTIYNTKTYDRVTIKLLRYHAPGQDFNYGSQPILLFPGLMENINEYLIYTTPEIDRYFDPSLPDDLAEWAQGDENIKEDPLLYYSVAYYLWKHGYDPWFANYRGIGYGSMKSSGGDSSTTLDDFAIYDVRAAVRKVYYVTHRHPYIGGHSTAGFTSIIYLQGCKYSWTGEVYSDSRAVAERNGDREGVETVKGFIGFEPAWIASLTSSLNNLLTWLIFNTGICIDMRTLAELTVVLMQTPIIGDIMKLLNKLILNAFPDVIANFFLNILNMDLTNIDAIWFYYFMAYQFDNLYLRSMGQYADSSTYDIVREYWQNGLFKKYLIKPPAPRNGDGYYYYSDDDNIGKFSVPAIFFFASHQDTRLDVVNSDKAIAGIVERKSNRDDDECYIINGAHVDFPHGLRAPVDVYPKLGAWLAKF